MNPLRFRQKLASLASVQNEFLDEVLDAAQHPSRSKESPVIRLRTAMEETRNAWMRRLTEAYEREERTLLADL